MTRNRFVARSPQNTITTQLATPATNPASTAGCVHGPRAGAHAAESFSARAAVLWLWRVGHGVKPFGAGAVWAVGAWPGQYHTTFWPLELWKLEQTRFKRQEYEVAWTRAIAPRVTGHSDELLG